VGLPEVRAKDLAEGVTFIKTLLKGAPASLGAANAHLPWIKRAPPVFSPPPIQAAAGGGADRGRGIRQLWPGRGEYSDSEAHIFAGARDAGRTPDEIENRQIGAWTADEDRGCRPGGEGAERAHVRHWPAARRLAEPAAFEPRSEPLSD